uniref:Claudin n=1 Tax=Pygocentrus nattereri TaxID=42514 RepID=A0A3B4BQ77_PYGNA
MASQGIQLIGIVAALLGWLGSIVSCGLPQWRVTAFVGPNIVTAQIIWEGIWMSCVVQSTGQMQCKVYDSMLALSSDLQAARAMIIISILAGIFGIVMSMAGGKCTNSHTIISDFYNPMMSEAQRRELGTSLYIGWASAGLLMMGGGLLCWNCPPKEQQRIYNPKFSPVRSTVTSREYV